MTDYHIYCPSMGRASTCFTHKLFKDNPRFFYVVNQNEEKQYRKLGLPLKVVPDGETKNIVETRNWILNNSDRKNIIQMDDDTKNICWTFKRKLFSLSGETLHRMIINGFRMAHDLGVKMWGMNVLQDPKAYTIGQPFVFRRPVLGPFTATLDIDLRYDTNLTLKEDYDFFLQVINKYGKVLRFQMLSYLVDHYTMQGGCQEYRTDDYEASQNEDILKKWGSKLIKENPRKNASNVKIGRI